MPADPEASAISRPSASATPHDNASTNSAPLPNTSSSPAPAAAAAALDAGYDNDEEDLAANDPLLAVRHKPIVAPIKVPTPNPGAPSRPHSSMHNNGNGAGTSNNTHADDNALDSLGDGHVSPVPAGAADADGDAHGHFSSAGLGPDGQPIPGFLPGTLWMISQSNIPESV